MIIRGIFYKPETAFFKLDADKMAYRNIPDTLDVIYTDQY